MYFEGLILYVMDLYTDIVILVAVQVKVRRKDLHWQNPANRDCGGEMAGLGADVRYFHFNSRAPRLQPKSPTGHA